MSLPENSLDPTPEICNTSSNRRNGSTSSNIRNQSTSSYNKNIKRGPTLPPKLTQEPIRCPAKTTVFGL